MTDYTLAATITTVTEDAGDGEDEKLIECDVGVLRDGTEFERFVQRFGYDISNQELRNALVRRVRKIIHDDHMDQNQRQETARLDAIKRAIESWSVQLP